MKNTEILLTIKLQQALFIDPKRVRLLKEIQQCGSINQAAKNAKVSYKSAWDHLEAMNKISPRPLLERNTGGKMAGVRHLLLMQSVCYSFMIY
ncbi:transcriptional regulator ModE [Haemophilus influenzae 22.4-21]|uniref:Transcriptional regulator ModE n=1 Tax=Haemophilus influenzae 22.4-21 TaxID=375063 RepID=A4NXT6_HAEIF|nr:transcriptional regulator ModE [Haemophilus influenzae 22.4-21]